MFKWNLLCFNLCPFHFDLQVDTTGKSLALSFLHLSLQLFVYHHVIRPEPLGFHSCRLSSPSSQPLLLCEMLQSLNQLCGALVDLISSSSNSLLYWGA